MDTIRSSAEVTSLIGNLDMSSSMPDIPDMPLICPIPCRGNSGGTEDEVQSEREKPSSEREGGRRPRAESSNKASSGEPGSTGTKGEEETAQRLREALMHISPQRQLSGNGDEIPNEVEGHEEEDKPRPNFGVLLPATIAVYDENNNQMQLQVVKGVLLTSSKHLPAKYQLTSSRFYQEFRRAAPRSSPNVQVLKKEIHRLKTLVHTGKRVLWVRFLPSRHP